jgi:preprotein translocase subunit SecA
VQQLSDRIYDLALKTYEAKEAASTPGMMREFERAVMLRVVDEYWMDNIDAMDDLKQGIGLRAYGQHDPVIAYKEEGFQLFEAMITAIREETVRRLFVMQLVTEEALKRRQVAKELSATGSGDGSLKKQPVRKQESQRIGPNDLCHCGSGKKYKKCCMQKDKTEGM